MTVISEKQDYQNKRMIALSPLFLGSIFGCSRARAHTLIYEATAEERAECVRKFRRRSVLISIAVALYMTILHFIPVRSEPPPVPKIVRAGQIQSVSLHEAAFATSTTVVTTTGVFQVEGAVSSTIGDSATLSTDTRSGYGEAKSLCVESAVKSACYPLL